MSANGKIQYANETTFACVVLEEKGPVLVDFYADWCGPCRRLTPVLEQLSAELDGVRIVKVDVDQSPGLAARYNISSIPALKVFRDGAVTDQLVGLANKQQLRNLLKL
jgi:thioredoxin 1